MGQVRSHAAPGRDTGNGMAVHAVFFPEELSAFRCPDRCGGRSRLLLVCEPSVKIFGGLRKDPDSHSGMTHALETLSAAWVMPEIDPISYHPHFI